MLKNGFFLLAIIAFIGCSTHKHTAPVDKEFMLNGKITREELDTNFTWFDANYNKYEVNDSIASLIRPLIKDISVTIVLGTWCSDSKAQVPAFFKVADAVRLPSSGVTLIAVDRRKSCSKVDITPLNIEHVPTFIVYKNGKLLGRIVENPQLTIEEDLLKILK